MLVKPQNISSRVAKPCSNFRQVFTGRLHYFTAVFNDQFNRIRNAINHNMDHQSNFSCWFAVGYPCTTYFTYSVIKGDTSINVLPYIPSKNFFVKS